MKTLIIYIALFVCGHCISQNEVPLDQFPNGGNIAGNYFKDINGVLDQYTGTWRWVDGNKELSIYLYKDEQVTITRSLNGTYYRDLVFGYYVYKEGGTTLINTRPVLLADLNNGEFTNRGGLGMWPTSDAIGGGNAPLLYFLDFSRSTCEGSPLSGSPGRWTFTSATRASIGLYTNGLILAECAVSIQHPGFPKGQAITIDKISNTAPPLN